MENSYLAMVSYYNRFVIALIRTSTPSESTILDVNNKQAQLILTAIKVIGKIMCNISKFLPPPLSIGELTFDENTFQIITESNESVNGSGNQNENESVNESVGE